MNVQGLTNEKYAEIQEKIGEKTLVCLTETQKKVNNIRIEEGITCIDKMRDVNQLKGGGLMVLFKEEEDFYFEEQKNPNSDCLHIKGRIGLLKGNIILVYLRTGTGEEVRNWNRGIVHGLQEALDLAQDHEEFLMILGDFNAHLGYLGYQGENENGKIINKLIEKNNLVLLNLDERCSGIYTWRRGEQSSAIDLVLVNEFAFSKFKSIKIDEKEDEIDWSDHCLVQADFKI